MKSERNPNQKAFKIVKQQIVIAKKPPEEPLPEIDTAKAVAFAMSIAQEMKRKQREEEEARKETLATEGPGSNAKYSDKDLQLFRKRLLAVREEILDSANALKSTVGINEADDIEPDGGDGSSQSMRLDVIGQIEKSNKTLTDIEEAQRRIADGSYGLCLTCGNRIDRERLLHRPFVKTCTTCQQKMERQTKP